MGALIYKEKLSKAGKEIWDRIVSTIDVDKDIYYESLYIYCIEMENYEYCVARLKELGRTQTSERTGYEQQRPEVAMAGQSLKACREIAHKFGFDPVGNKKLNESKKSPKEQRKTTRSLRKAI